MKKERGSVTLFVLIAMLFFSMFTIGLFMLYSNKQTTGIQATEKIKEIYEKDVNNMEGVYATLTAEERKNSLPQTADTTPYLPDDSFKKLAGTDLNTGLVVTDGTNEYVWVEVPKSITASATTPEQIETALQNYASAYRVTGYTDTWYDGCGIADATAYNTLKNKMLNSLKTYGGFWIGRYEAGTADNSIRTSSSAATTSKAVSAQDRYQYHYVTCGQAQEIANRNSTSNCTSSIMFGLQWDLTCKYLESKGIAQVTIKTDSISIGNYKNANFIITRGKYSNKDGLSYTNVSGNYTKLATTEIILTTGASERNKTMNIYDLAGNEWEWTLENSSISNSLCVGRGGVCDNDGNYGTLASKGNETNSCSAGNVSFRLTLYK